MVVDGTLRVLLVDDDEDDYLITRELLSEGDHFAKPQIDWLDDYDAALEEIKRQRHDIYLLDYHLGARDGLSLLRDALDAGCRAPIIMLTGQGGREVDLEAMDRGAYDFLVKGQISSQVLERSIRYAMRHSRSIGALRRTVRLSSALVATLNNLDEAVLITDPLQNDNPVIYLNPTFERITGYSRDMLVGHNSRLLRGELTDPEAIERLRIALEIGHRFEEVLIHYRSDGRAFRHKVRVFPVTNNHGEVIHWISLSRDLGDL